MQRMYTLYNNYDNKKHYFQLQENAKHFIRYFIRAILCNYIFHHILYIQVYMNNITYVNVTHSGHTKSDLSKATELHIFCAQLLALVGFFGR